MILKPTATINLDSLRHNLQAIRRMAPAAAIMAVIKADAYGHGLQRIATALSASDGLAVAHLSEARQLREGGYQGRILLLSGLLDGRALVECAHQHIDIVVHHWRGIELLQETSLPGEVNIWLKLDTGMHRLGLSYLELPKARAVLDAMPQVKLQAYMTHFSAAEAEENDARQTESSQQQLQRFQQAIEALPKADTSVANSAAIMRGTLCRQGSPGEWLRPGIMLYGANPLPPALQKLHPVSLRPVMTLNAPVIATRVVKAGEYVGYNGRWQAPVNSIIATLSIGYADGYPRHATNGTPVLINGQRVPLIGTVSMDMICVDISQCGPVEVGDQATLWGEGLPVEEVAAHADTISYELLTGIGPRVIKEYIDESVS